jgi:DNA-binding response OmpR family regulator/anti-anti-sigma regulatory factor
MSDKHQSPILVVEDNPGNLELLIETLSRAGFELAIATSGEGALQLVDTEPPSVILLDVNLPGIDGFETCRRLKENPATRDIPILFMTAFSDTYDRIKGFAMGAVDYIVKPFRSEELVARTQVHVNLVQMRKKLVGEIEERIAAESALQRLTLELERRVEERTYELARAVDELKLAQVQRDNVTAELRSSNERLENEVARQTEALREANERLKRELAERARAEEKRAELQEEIIRAQTENLKELSTPLIPITERVLVMPLIGSVSAERARQVLETALFGVHSSRAEVVIFDVTGAKRTDAAVAGMLVSTAAALRLIGARTVLTGVRPEMAELFIECGVDLGAIVVKGTLMSGMVYALSILKEPQDTAGRSLAAGRF